MHAGSSGEEKPSKAHVTQKIRKKKKEGRSRNPDYTWTIWKGQREEKRPNICPKTAEKHGRPPKK